MVASKWLILYFRFPRWLTLPGIEYYHSISLYLYDCESHPRYRLTPVWMQEIQFINGLVRLGKFKVNELDDVVAMLFPTKSADEHKQLLDKLCEGRWRHRSAARFLKKRSRSLNLNARVCDILIRRFINRVELKSFYFISLGYF